MSVPGHCAACLLFLHAALCAAMWRSAQSLKVIAFSRVELRCHTPRFACFDRVVAVKPRLAAFERLLPCLGEADGMGRTQPHFPQLAAFLKTEHPAFRPTGAHLQKEPAAVAVIAAVLSLGDCQRSQLPDRSRHSPSYYPSL